MSYQIVGLANAVVDMCFRIDGFPIRPSEHQFTRNRLITPGGLANTLLCGARLGLNMKSIGNMGNDELGQLWRRHLEAEGVDTSDQIEYVDQPTTIAIALSDDAGEHLFIGSRGDLKVPNGRFPEVWRKSIAAADGLFIYGWNYLSQGPEANLEAMKTAQAANIPVFFDPGPEIFG